LVLLVKLKEEQWETVVLFLLPAKILIPIFIGLDRHLGKAILEKLPEISKCPKY
jgi:hypothetical protein